MNISSNPFFFNDTINVLNNNTLNSTDLVFITSVFYNLTNITSNVTVNSSLEVVGPLHFLIKTFDTLLAVNFTQAITVIATPNLTIETSCAGTFVQCPAFFNTTEPTNQTTLNVNISISNTTAVGNYSDFLILRQGNSTQTFTFDIEVDSGTERIISITEIIDLDKCFESPEEFAKCKQEQSKLEAQIAQKFLEELQRTGSCTNETVYEDKFVVVGSLDEDFREEIDSCRDDNDNLRKRILDIDEEFIDCKIKLTDEGSQVFK